MNEIILSEKNGQVLASSREVAERFGKAHDKVKRSIKSFEKDVAIFGEMFILSYYDDSYGRKQEEYLMTRDGFSLLCMGFTGKKALEWKLKYIDAFNQMEDRLKNGNQLTEEEKLKLMLFSKDASEVAYAHNRLIELATAPLIAENEELKPKAEYHDEVLKKDGLITTTVVANDGNANEDVDYGSILVDIGSYKNNPKTVAEVVSTNMRWAEFMTSSRYVPKTDTQKAQVNALKKYLEQHPGDSSNQ